MTLIPSGKIHISLTDVNVSLILPEGATGALPESSLEETRPRRRDRNTALQALSRAERGNRSRPEGPSGMDEGAFVYYRIPNS